MTPSSARSRAPRAARSTSERSRAQPPSRRSFGLPVGLGLLLIAGAVLVLYGPALRAPFFADDYLFLDQVRGRSLLAVLAEPDPIGNFFRPVSRQLWFWVLSRVGGESPAVFHAAALALLLAILGLVFAIGRRVAGERAGVIAAALVAQHYAADVPVRWASGSQELLAVLGALAALWLTLARRAWLAALALLLAMLSKETAVVTPLIAIALLAGAGASARDPDSAPPSGGIGWRGRLTQVLPLAIAVAAWAALWLTRTRPEARAAAGMRLGLSDLAAAFVHLPQVALGAEWEAGAPLALGGALAATALLLPIAWTRERAPSPRLTIGPGAAWALAAALPVAVVGAIWSAYYYLLAMAGVALLLGVWLARRSPWLAAAAIAILGIGSAHARDLRGFALARTPWTTESHLNRFYMERAIAQVDRYLGALRALRPMFPPNSTLFFAGLKGNVAFQTADGPLLRWAYRDPTLRSYWLNQFSRDKVRAGQVFLIVAAGDELRTPGPDDFAAIGFALLVSDRLEGARDALDLARTRGPGVAGIDAWRGWLHWALGDTLAALRLLEGAGARFAPGPAPEVPVAMAALAAGDTARAFALANAAVDGHAADARAHALLADLLLLRNPNDPDGAVETLAARTLAPKDPSAWRRYAMIQMNRNREPEALASLERYFQLAGPRGAEDGEARGWLAALERRMPGGELSQRSLRE